jgi:hypothetical protein
MYIYIFTGTETATVWSGFLNGAIQAGERAAEEISERLNGKEHSTETKAIDFRYKYNHHASGPTVLTLAFLALAAAVVWAYFY